METNLQTVGNVVVIELLGDSLDVSNSDDVKSTLGSLATANLNAVVDLGQLHFLDSSGCGALIECQRRFREAGGEMRLCNPSKNVRTVLEIARLTRILGVHNTRDEAIAAFSSRQ